MNTQFGIPPSSAEIRLHELAREYQEVTEAYDRTVCTGPILRGGIMPVTQDERRLCSANAISASNRLFVEVAKLGFDRAQWNRAIRNAERRMRDTRA